MCVTVPEDPDRRRPGVKGKSNEHDWSRSEEGNRVLGWGASSFILVNRQTSGEQNRPRACACADDQTKFVEYVSLMRRLHQETSRESGEAGWYLSGVCQCC